MKNIISASRRTDIPAFYTDWFVKRLREQYVFVTHPYTKEIYHVSLRLEDILGIVFWSKNFSPLISRIDEIEKVTKSLFFHFTITGMSKDLEANVPSHEDCVDDLIFISKRYSPDSVIWRFDPICITDAISFEEHIEAFSQCAEKLKGFVRICYISFVNPYYKVIKNFQRYTKQRLLEMPDELKRIYARQLISVAKQYGIQLYACCNDYLLLADNNPPSPTFFKPLRSPKLRGGIISGTSESSNEIQKGSCINKNNLSRIWGIEGLDYEEPSPTRKECACTRSIDIGAYDTCPHGCIYCYANTDKEQATDFYKNFNPEWNAMGGNVEREAVHAG